MKSTIDSEIRTAGILAQKSLDAEFFSAWMQGQKRKKDLVVNWHLTEACNYRCGYCYAHWERLNQRELIHDHQGVEALLQQLGEVAARLNDGQRLRLNLAGGEPLLYAERCTRVLSRAHALGMSTSIITNGSLLTHEWIENNGPVLSVLGVSLDSTHDETLENIGRIDRRGGVDDWRRLVDMIRFARSVNPDIVIKVNTVVNELNWKESMDPVLSAMKPDQWKVLQMLPSITDKFRITDQQFRAFVERHDQWTACMRVEDNQSMQESYLMIDPFGRLFQNGNSGHGYSYSAAVHEVGFMAAVDQIRWSPLKFFKRYDSAEVTA